MTRMTPEAVAAHQARMGKPDPLQEIIVKAGFTEGKVPSKSKYRNQKVQVDGMTFDSKWEASCWHRLKMEERAGSISFLHRQVRFELIPPLELDGKKVPATVYVADFVYMRDGVKVVEDAKGMASLPDYKIKRKLMKWIHGITVMELRK